MPSAALSAWLGARRDLINELYSAHRSVGGVGRGRRTATGQLNWSLALRLAGEFQGYVRDLHDQAVPVLSSAAPTAQLRSVIANTFTLGRKLDQGNANPSTLQQDFLRIGIPILDRVKAAKPRGAAWLGHLEDLNTARNAIAHSQPAKLAAVLDGAPTLRLAQVRRWDASLQQLASTMDVVVAAELALLVGGNPPW